MPTYVFSKDTFATIGGEISRHFAGETIELDEGEAHALVADGSLVLVVPPVPPKPESPLKRAKKAVRKAVAKVKATAKKAAPKKKTKK